MAMSTTAGSRTPKRASGAARRPARAGATGRPRAAGREPAVAARPPSDLALRAFLLVVGLGLGLVIGLAIVDETGSELATRGGLVTFAGNLTGLVGTYLALVMVLLASRLPVIERILGHDGLLRWHRRLGPWPLSLLFAHAVLVTLGYAQAARTGFLHELGTFISAYPDMLAATVALGLLVLVGLASIGAVRRRLRRETWWALHLYVYLAIALAFAHILVLGQSFVGHPLTIALWWVVWLATAGVVLVFRFALPAYRSLRHRLRVVEVRPEGPGVTSVICAGHKLERLPLSGGQFLLWRFLVPGLWWQAHPYSVSALPQPPYLRLTVKAVGDHSAALARLHPGTRVAIEGPYGAFTPAARRRKRVLLVAGGIGVTAVRALLEELTPAARPVVVVRASRAEDVVLRDELVALARERRGSLHEVIGRRDDAALDDQTILGLSPDVTDREVFLCGPAGFVESVRATLEQLGVPPDAIHHEAFAL